MAVVWPTRWLDKVHLRQEARQGRIQRLWPGERGGRRGPKGGSEGEALGEGKIVSHHLYQLRAL